MYFIEKNQVNLVIMDGESNKNYLEEEQIKSNLDDEQNKKVSEKIPFMKDLMEQFFENLSKE